jgi:predicted RND superfamily exporter protein
MKAPFFARRSRIPGLSNGLLIMMIVCFLVPFALRGAKMVTQRMENDIKDWLPEEFEETRQLDWFGKLFLGEQFIVITWEGCSEEDPGYQLFVEKLKAEVIPHEDLPTQTGDPQQLEEARQLGERLGLYTSSEWRQGGRRERDNWAGQQEKWLKDLDGRWYYILPDGSLYRWDGRDNIVDGLSNWIHHDLLKDFELKGTLIDQLGDLPDPPFDHNDYYDNPRLACARFFTSVRTGPEVLEELAGVGGPLRPRGNVDLSEEALVEAAYRDGMDRLTGTLFAPALSEGFSWTDEQVWEQLDEARRTILPADWKSRLEQFVQLLVEENYEGDRQLLIDASSLPRARHWEALCEKLEIDPPPRQTSIVVTLSDFAKRDLQRVVGRGLLDNPAGRLVELSMECGLAAPVMPPLTPWTSTPEPDGVELRMGGPPVDNGAIDEEGQVTLSRLVPFSLLLGIVLSFLAFRSMKVTFMIFFVGGTSAVLSLGIVWYTGGSADAILMSMPSLVYVLGLSGAVHIVNYYRDAVLEDGPEGAAERALSHGWWPCTLAAFTTSLGLISLYNSGLTPIKKFGLFSAIGVMASVILLFSYLPAALTAWPPRFSRKKRKPGQVDSSLTANHSLLTRFWMRVGGGVTKHWGLAMAACLVVLFVCGLGLFKVNTSVQLLKLFDGNAKIVKDYEWLEKERGKLVPMEVVLKVDREFQLPLRDELPELATMPVAERNRMKYQYSFLERVELVDRVQSAVETVFGEDGQEVIGRGMSATSFAPAFPPPGARTQRSSTNALMERNRDRLMEEDYLAIDTDDAGREIWRISLRLGALNDVDYGQFVDQLREVVDPIVAAYGFRNWMLEKIESDRGDEEQYNPPNIFFDDNRILVLGAHPRGSIVDVNETATTAIDRYQVNPQQLFLKTFNDLMRIKGFSNRYNHPSELYWVDPGQEPFSEKLSSWSEEDWSGFLARYDYVILLADHALLDRSVISRHGGFIDAVPTEDGPMVASSHAGESGLDTIYTGTVPIVYKAQTTLLKSLRESIGMAFGMILVVMVFLLRNGPMSLARVTFWVPAIAFAVVAIPLHMLLGVSIWIAGLSGMLVVSMVCFGNITGGLISMIPNVFPVVVVFGLMGHAGVMVDIGAMMTASVAMGVAVDDTIHFLNWFRLGLNSGLDRCEAIQQSYQRCAAAMTQTTLIGGLGLSVFAISTFTPTQRFGVLMLTLLSAALVGDLIFLPALLVSPLGRYLSPAKKKKLDKTVTDVVEIESDVEVDDGPQPHLGAGRMQRHDPPHRRKPG